MRKKQFHWSRWIRRIAGNNVLLLMEVLMGAHSSREIHTLFLDAFNRAELEALVALYEPGAVFVTRSELAKGHEAIRAAYQHILAEGGRMEMETRTVVESGDDVAMLHGAWTLHRNDAAISGLSTEVVRRQADGTWLFVLDEPRTPS